MLFTFAVLKLYRNQWYLINEALRVSSYLLQLYRYYLFNEDPWMYTVMNYER